MVRYTTRTRFFGLGRRETSRLPKIMAMPEQEVTRLKIRAPPFGFGRTKPGSVASKAEATRFTPAINRISVRIMGFCFRKDSPPLASDKTLSSFCTSFWGIEISRSNARKAMAKLPRSRAITSFRPAKEYTAVAISGFRIEMSDLDRDCRPLARWYCSRGMSRVMATSEAGCCTVFMSPKTALRRYRCHPASRPMQNKTRTVTVHTAAKLSQQSMSFFLSNRSVKAPANMLIRI